MEETHAFLLFPYFTRIMRLLSGYALEEGVELRAPLMDARVVRFAAERPWHERANGRETKLVLRGAMRGVLPDNVLAPREKRTGTTSAYFLRQLRAAGRPHFESMLTDSRLADVGMIDPGRLRRAWEHLIAHGDDELGVRLYFTLQAERWLRARAA
jgi:asparagine synthase (glutamine-hydrolysing)